MKNINLVPIETVLELKENNEPFILVEVLGAEEFKKGHLPQAVNIPLAELEEKAPAQLKKDVKTIVYCANYHCTASTKAARKLVSLGFKDVLDFKAGKKGWQEAGLELVT